MTRVLPALLAAMLLSPVPAVAEDEPTLASQLEEMTAQSASRLPAEMRQTFAAAIDEVKQTGIEKSAKQVGDRAADGELVTATGEKVRLSQLWSQQPIVVTWYRGGWCPYCNVQLRAMQQALGKLDGAGARLVAITPELPQHAQETAKSNDLTFLVLHDKQNELAHQYGVVFDLPGSVAGMYRDRLQLAKVNGYDELELPLAATYVIDTDGVIRWAFLDADYKKRAEPAEIVAAVEKLEE